MANTSSDSREEIRFYLSRRVAFINSQVDQLYKELIIVTKLLQEQHIESIDVTKSLSHSLLPATPSPRPTDPFHNSQRNLSSNRSAHPEPDSESDPQRRGSRGRGGDSALQPRVYAREEAAPAPLRPALTSTKSSGHLREQSVHPAYRSVESQSMFKRLRSFSKG